ncbi:hypothetical protein MIND_00868500 [Mycena indigotica]|uniref:Uncharacterized protein n=1 Tax=Mycena indigotica TaxID=2126181 RepID=A0A8H6SHS7_9AGAR|nr:uncharacterized protein MIND_00868500 [Mycena indigotica]KAF7299198.1 hypothetical protein MIND_00868500 [Mycena indigotica]
MNASIPKTPRTETFTHKGFRAAGDATASRRRPGASFVNALLATALFRCWHILLFFAAWSTCITVLDDHHFKVRIPLTLLTVQVSSSTVSEPSNRILVLVPCWVSLSHTGRLPLLNAIMRADVCGHKLSLRLGRLLEPHGSIYRVTTLELFSNSTSYVPDQAPVGGLDAATMKSRGMVEKKTVINLVEAFAVAVKHYLRGEDGIYYQDLYYLVKFLPAYALPPGIPSNADLTNMDGDGNLSPRSRPSNASGPPPQSSSLLYQRNGPASSMSAPHLPLPVSTPERGTRRISFSHGNAQTPNSVLQGRPGLPPPLTISPPTRRNSLDEKRSTELRSVTSIRSMRSPVPGEPQKIILARADESYLLPASMPPKYHIFDLFPFSLLVRSLTKRGKELKGKKAARLRAKIMREKEKGSHNLPLEISLYLSSYISALQVRKQMDVPTTNTLLAALNQLVDALTGLERILTTPVPYSYSIHLWLVATLYCLALPSQIVSAMGWITIPATSLLAFVFFGFLVAGEEIENPFGYDKNDLNLDHFTNNIIRTELRAITSAAAPDPDRWIFAAENDMLFSTDVHHDERVGPETWVRRGTPAILGALSMV